MPAKGCKLIYTVAATVVHQLIFYGIAKGPPAIGRFLLDTKPEKTDDLPEVARRIVRLAK